MKLLKHMGIVKVASFSLSMDGFGAGPDQSLESPLGVGGQAVHNWVFPTRMFKNMQQKEGGTEGVDNDFAEKSMENVGAWIMGRNMFGPIRGAWLNDDWKGWWGSNPPYHVPVYILTNHPRKSLTMEGGTIFHFVTDGIEAALQQAKVAANGKDIRIGGGVSTVRQYLLGGHIHEMHLVFSPVFLGSGEHFFAGIDLPRLGFSLAEKVNTPNATHVVLKKK